MVQTTEHGERLPKNVNIRSFNRPVKVAFLVSIEDTKENNWTLDAIFRESYTRWGGAHSLVIPFDDSQVLDDSYIKWLTFLDPDFIYSYVELNKQTINKIDIACSPIQMIKHEIIGEIDRWQQFTPQWPHGFTPVKSVSTLTSPLANYPSWSSTPTPQIYITQRHANDEYRFLPDNFGVEHDTTMVTYGREGLFETLSYCDENIPENNTVGNYRSHSLNDIIEKLASKQLRTFSRLARIYSDGIAHPSDHNWGDEFHLFIGDTVSDRLNFWNSRHLADTYTSHDISSLIISPDLLEDDEFITQIGLFLNNYNFKGSNNGPAKTSIRSLSQNKELCQDAANKLQKHTWTMIRVNNNFSSYVLPDERSYTKHFQSMGEPCPSIKINESHHTYITPEPEHFQFIPPSYLYAKTGQWLVELNIERYQDDCQFSNVFNDWKLPKRHEVTHAFTDNISKVSSSGNLTVIPTAPQHPFQQDLGSKNKINLKIPDDNTVFRYLVLDIPPFKHNDIRVVLNRDNKYKSMRISDKGQGHRGVTALFQNDINAASALTNKFWREMIRQTHDQPQTAYTLDQLRGLINNIDADDLQYMKNQMRFADISTAKKFLRNNMEDTVERFVHLGVIHQTHKWRCHYCGHINHRNLDTLKLLNSCDICQDLYETPIDMEWNYSISPFVSKSLAEHNGLTVLWGIFKLLDRSRLRQSIYLPEIDLYHLHDDKKQKNELDILALIDGQLVLAEAKLSAASFIDKKGEQEIFIDEIKRINPDIAYLIFEQYCHNKDDKENYTTKLEKLLQELAENIPENIELKVLMAETDEEFSSAPLELGPYGRRTYDILDSLPRD